MYKSFSRFYFKKSKYIIKERKIDVAEFKKIYIAGKRGKIICAGDCYHVKNIKPENRLIFSSVDEALDNGCKRVCKYCLGTYAVDIWRVAQKRRHQIISELFVNENLN